MTPPALARCGQPARWRCRLACLAEAVGPAALLLAIVACGYAIGAAVLP